jgi:hypothetical protein
MTPFVAVALGVSGLILAVFRLPLPADYLLINRQMMVEIIVLAAAIAFLGPGALSVDARMFGRREIRIPSGSALSSDRQQ